MRPIRLEVEGITCFRERQQVEFDGLSVFAIAGPTGAGKSSLLDAMVLALYGQVPRMGKQGLAELISLGADRGSVLFEYEVGGQRWRVGRRMRRAGATVAQLERIDADGVRAVAEGVREVDERIAATLGLGSDAFLRAVVLPQGRFDVFLRSPPSKQQDILTELLRLQVYERMQQAASEGFAARKGRVEWLDQRRTELGAASEAAVAAAEADAADAAAAVERAAAERERAAADAADRERRRAAWDTLDRVERDRAAHLAAADALAALSAGLDRARVAAELTPGLDALDRLAQDEARLASALSSALARRHLVDRDEAEAAEAWDRATAEASGVPAARARIEALTEVLGAVTARESARQRAVGHRSREQQLRSAASAHADRAAAAREALARLERERAAWVPVSFDPAELARLEALRAPAAATGAARAEVARLATDAARLGLAAADAAHEAAAAEPAAVAASDAAAAAELRLATAQRAVHVGRAAHTAATLRHHLVEGEPCPVCEQRVAEVPAGGSAPDTSAAEAELALAEREERAARSRAAAALQALTRARGAAEGAADTARLAEEARVAASGRLAALEASLGVLDGDGPPEGRVLAALHRVGALAKAHADAVSTAQRWEVEASARRTEVAAAEAAAAAAAASADREADGAAGAGAELASAEAQIRAVTDHPDPRVERDEWKARVDRWTAAVDGAGLRKARAVEARLRAAAERDAAEAAAIAAAAARAAAERAIDERLRSHGFTDRAEARRAAWGAAERTAAEHRLRAYHIAGARLEAAHADAVAVAGPVRVGAAEVAAAVAAAASATAAYEAAVGRAAQAAHAVTLAQAAWSEARAVRGEHAEAAAEAERHQQLAHDLRANGFRAWLLRDAFEALVTGASARLGELSGRYALSFDPERREILVVDHDNADETRRADTLSGGESFLASLALALELSEQVQRTTGAVRLDSLFVDEGFGTLDPETLDTVASAIETLGATRRMVGIITHVAGLTERLPARLDVRKGPSGSTVTRVVP